MSQFDFKNVTTEAYYGTPPDDVFSDIKAKAIAVWADNYSDEYGYVTEKTSQIEPMQNFKDNAWCIVSMFDNTNQSKLWQKLEPATILYLETFMGVQ